MGVETTTLEIEARLKGIEQSIAGLEALKRSGGGAETSLGDLAKRIAGFTSLAGLAVQAGQKTIAMLVDLGKQSITLAAGFEKARTTWGVLVGDMDRGSKVFDDIREFAARTPLSFEGLNAAATTIKGFGAATEDLIPTLGRLGDVAMGDNEKLQRLALVYGQVMAQGKAKTQDLYQFINAGVPIFNLLAESMGKSAGEIKNLTAEGAVTFEEIDKAIKQATGSGGLFNDMMGKTAETTSGKWSTAMDNFKASLAEVGEKLLPAINKLLDAYNTKMKEAAANKNAWNFLQKGEGSGDAALEFLQGELAKYEPQLANLEASFKAAGVYGQYIKGPLEEMRIRVALLKTQISEVQQLDLEQQRLRGSMSSGVVMPETTVLKPYQQTLQGLTGDTDMTTAIAKITDEAGKLAQVAAALGTDLSKPFEEAKGKLVDLYEKMSLSGTLGPVWSGLLVTAIGAADDAIKATTGSTSELNQAIKESIPASKNVLEVNQALAGMYDDLNDAIKRTGLSSTEYKALTDELYAAQVRLAGGTEEDVKALLALRDSLEKATKEQEAAERLKKSLESIGDVFKDAGADAWVATFTSLGESLASGADAAENFGDAMANIGRQILNALPMMLLQAALNAFAAGQWQLGMTLLAASGVSAVGAGIANESQAQAQANALGGVYRSPSLASYENGIYNSPQTFAFAKGSAFGWEGSQAFARGGVFGEAGPEAIMPLRRDSSGRLGVTAAAAPLTVQVVNNLGVSATADVTETMTPNGARQLQVTLEKAVTAMLASGKADAAMSRYGARPRGRRTI